MPDKYFSGDHLYGDDFSYEEIQQWFEHEKEGYANLGKHSTEGDLQDYGYHALNKLFGFNHLHLPDNSIALGIGAAYGVELLPAIKKLKEIHILEPSDQLVSENLEGVKLFYKKPEVDGTIPYEDNSFDLITCFGTLHHIPNVSKVMAEMKRVLKPGGYMLIREPIISMGDWTKPRQGLTKYERGIPLKIFREIISELQLKTVKETPCFTMTFFLQRLLKTNLYPRKWYAKLDRILSRLFLFNAHYHAKNPLQRISPTNIFYILRK